MKPSVPQGTRDFSSSVLRKRYYILDTIRSVFELYGFEPLETPAMENLETLMGKYGEEGDKLIFKILNNGLDHAAKRETALEDFGKVLDGKINKGITERALRYDLTIPFARYVAMNHGQLVMPFKRYQMQPVWRADRPQRGRYREFYQCDADVAGSNSLLHEIEFVQIYTAVFKKLNIGVEIRINNRKLLSALASICGGVDKMLAITTAIDKLDKIGWEKVTEELGQKGLGPEQVETVGAFISMEGDNETKLAKLEKLFTGHDLAAQGISELREILNAAEVPNGFGELKVDLSLARGLNYYTGTLFEVKAKQVQMGSIGGGGRYDDLTGLFGVNGVGGVGISFGVDRIYDVMEELQVFPESIHKGSTVLFFNTGKEEQKTILKLAASLRENNIGCEIFQEPAKFDKQFKYAEKKLIPYVAIVGSREIENGTAVIKHLPSGVQKEYSQSVLGSIFTAQPTSSSVSKPHQDHGSAGL